MAPARASAGAHGGEAGRGKPRRVDFAEGGLGCHSSSTAQVDRAFSSAWPHVAHVRTWDSTPSRTSASRRSIRKSSICSTTWSHVIMERLQSRTELLNGLVHLPLHGAERD